MGNGKEGWAARRTRIPDNLRLPERIGIGTTLLVFIADLFRPRGSAWTMANEIWFALLAVVAIFTAYAFYWRNARKIRYASMISSIHRAHHLVRDATSAILLRNAHADEVIPTLREALAAVREVFSTMTGTPCRVCLKEVTWPGGVATATKGRLQLRNLQVSTMCRDSITGPKDHDDRNAFVDQNTHFEVLFLDRGRYPWFCCNDLLKLDQYKNSHWADPPHEYLATCVWPVQKTDETEAGRHDIVAFLCVDALETNVFDMRFDFDAGAAFADAIYPLLKLMHKDDPRVDPTTSADATAAAGPRPS